MLDGFHVGLLLPGGDSAALEAGLCELELRTPPLRRLELRGVAGGELLALLGFDDDRSFIMQHAHVGALATNLMAQIVDLENLNAERKLEFQLHVAALPLRAGGDSKAAFAELRRQSQRPVLRVNFDSQDELLSAWARHVGEGALWVPTGRATEASSFDVVFATPDGEFGHSSAVRVNRSPPPGSSGLWLDVRASDELRGLISRVGQERRESRQQRAPARAIQRKETDLDFEISGLTELEAHYTSDLKHGGLFVPTADPPAMRAQLRLHLKLPNGEVLTLPAEVVHRVLAGPQAGVGLHFTALTHGTFAAIEALLAAAPHRRPRVLVVDDEAIWRSTLVRVLKDLDADVTLAKDGREGLVKLIDGYFDLDLVILDLHMPHLDGRSLIDRVRRLGGDSALKIFLFTGTPRDELHALGENGLFTGVFSKLDPLDVLASRLARELGRQWPPKQPFVGTMG